MLSEFRNRLRQQPAKTAATAALESHATGEAGADAPMAWENSAPDALYETKSRLSPMEAEWREKIYQQLLKVMDLSLLDSLEPDEAARQIRELSQRLLDEYSAPVSASSRQLIIKQIGDGAVFAYFVGQQKTDKELVTLGKKAILDTGLFATQYQGWKRRPNNARTWSDFEEYWQAEYDLWHKTSNTAAQVGYGGNVKNYNKQSTCCNYINN